MSQRPARIDHAFVKVLESAKHSAAQNGQRFVTVEHVIRASLRDAKTIAIFEEFGLDVRDMNQYLIGEINLDQPKRRPIGPKELVITDELNAMLDLIGPVKKLYGLDDSILDIPGFYMTVLDNYRGPATDLLFQCGFRGGDFRSYSPIAPKNPPASQQFNNNAANDAGPKPAAQNNQQQQKKPVTATTTKKGLPDYLVDLNAAATNGKIDPIIGREHEIEQTIETLSRRKKNNPILVGEPGVGKTAIAEGLAKRIAEGNVPECLKNKTIYSLNIGSLIAGTTYRGEFEERLKKVIEMMQKDENAILFADEIHTLIGAGKSGGSMDAANLMKPALQRGDLRCMGATTYKEFRNHFEKDGAMVRRFQKIDVKEPTKAEAIAILKGGVSGYEKAHGVTYSEEALTAAVELSVKYLPQLRLPDKAFDVVDVAGARQKVAPAGQRKEVIDVREIEKVVARMANRPDTNVSADEAAVLENLEGALKENVFHQDKAIEQLVVSVEVARAGLQTPDKPVGSFLFTGPTGVGKTEVAKQLAAHLGIELKRFDMSEYMEKHTVSRLIGAPPGYVGFDQGGLLTDAVDRTPQCVVLLDEIEKAHPDVYNILLQVMDNGALTDNNGKKIDFRNVILIMTSNVGAGATSANSIGVSSGKASASTAYTEAVNARFTPEFRNRLDAIINFDELNPAAIRQVTDKFLKPVIDQAAEKNITLELTEGARQWLSTKGFNREMGARPMGRVIHEYIKKPLAPKMLYGELKNGGYAKFSFNTEAKPSETPLVLEVSAKAPAGNSGGAPQRQRVPV